MTNYPDVAAVNRATASVLMDDNTILPITTWFDAGGDKCGPDEAVVCVAGPTVQGQWMTIDLRLFEGASIQ